MSFLSEQIFGLVGKRWKKKFLMIESDDWGLVRMPDQAAFGKLKTSGIPVNTCPYNTYDALEREEDIAIIHEFCNSFKDVNGNPLQVTANFIMANPDFEAIKDSGYQNYKYDDLKGTYLKHQGGLKSLEAVLQAQSEGTFMPQLHAREHLQVNHWLRALRRGDMETHLAFDQAVFGHPSSYAKKSGIHFLSAFHINNIEDLGFAGKSVLEAADMFEDAFGFRSKTFIAPRYIWPMELEPYFKKAGIEVLQGTSVQLRPGVGEGQQKFKKRINWMGRKNPFGLNYITRNVFFEPAQNPYFSWETDAMRRIDTAFFWGKPVVISMHRLNFMGGFSEENRKNSLHRLSILMKHVQKKYPEVEFNNSNEWSGQVFNKDKTIKIEGCIK